MIQLFYENIQNYAMIWWKNSRAATGTKYCPCGHRSSILPSRHRFESQDNLKPPEVLSESNGAKIKKHKISFHENHTFLQRKKDDFNSLHRHTKLPLERLEIMYFNYHSRKINWNSMKNQKEKIL